MHKKNSRKSQSIDITNASLIQNRLSINPNQKLNPITGNISKVYKNNPHKKRNLPKNNVINDEFEKIKEEINEKIRIRKDENLERLVEAIDHKNDFDNEKILKYVKEKENERLLFKDINRFINLYLEKLITMIC